MSARTEAADRTKSSVAGAVTARAAHASHGQRLDPFERLVPGLGAGVRHSILILPAIILWLSFRDAAPIEPHSTYSFLHYVESFGDPSIVRALSNTIVFTLVSLVVALFFGVPAAWLVTRTDLPCKTLLETMMTIG